MTNLYWPSPEPDSLGGMIGADDVRDAIKALILEWSPYYIFALSERLAANGQIGGTDAAGNTQPPNPLPKFGTWVNEPRYRSYGTGQPAAFLVTVPGTVGAPDLQSSGQYIATWRTQVTINVFGDSWEEAGDLVSWYEKVVRWCVIQNRSINQLAMATKWAGHQFTAEMHSGTRTDAQCVVGFDVTVGNVSDASRGPMTVPDPFSIPPQDPTVESVVTTLSITPDSEGLP